MSGPARIPVVLIFDIGKTNKKALLFDENYSLVKEVSTRIPEVADDDGFACEDLGALVRWIADSAAQLSTPSGFEVRAVNVSAYGASLVHVDESGLAVTPLYNYHKPYPKELQELFYKSVGGEEAFTLATCSPALGNLNSGLQLFRLKHENPSVFRKVKHSLHLPQYLTNFLGGPRVTEITSVGCHTGLWNFHAREYHFWVANEGVLDRLAPFMPATTTWRIRRELTYAVGTGLHDSSAALIPYLLDFREPFVLVSTGTWNISMNPFNTAPLSIDELRNDCLCYLDFQGHPVKAARLLAGPMFEEEMARLEAQFHLQKGYFDGFRFQRDVFETAMKGETPEALYYRIVSRLVKKQAESIERVMTAQTNNIFVDGGFSRNEVFMTLLAMAFPDKKVYAASLHEASALGAAAVIHKSWNTAALRAGLVNVDLYSNLRTTK